MSLEIKYDIEINYNAIYYETQTNLMQKNCLACIIAAILLRRFLDFTSIFWHQFTIYLF